MSATIPNFPSAEEVTQSLPKVDETAVVVPPTSTPSESSTNSKGIGMTVKGDKIYLSGIATKNFYANLKKLGGVWNKYERHWSFDSSTQTEINTFLSGVESGQIKPEPSPYHAPTHHNNSHKSRSEGQNNSEGHKGQRTDQAPLIPVYVNPRVGSNMKTVGPWSVFVPTVGMYAKIRVENQVATRKVTHVSGDAEKGYVIMVVDDSTGGESRLAISNGHWEVRGMMPHHIIRFE